MRAGDLDRRVIIQRAATTTDDYNEPVQEWQTLVSVRAAKLEISDGERFRAGEVYSDKAVRFKVRWQKALERLDTSDRVIFEDRVYDIVAVKEIGRRDGIEITATARAEAPTP